MTHGDEAMSINNCRANLAETQLTRSGVIKIRPSHVNTIF